MTDNIVCKECGVKMTSSSPELHVLAGGGNICLYCRLKWLIRFESFLNFWLRSKVTSEHGIQENLRILKEIQNDIAKTKRKIAVLPSRR